MKLFTLSQNSIKVTPFKAFSRFLRQFPSHVLKKMCSLGSQDPHTKVHLQDELEILNTKQSFILGIFMYPNALAQMEVYSRVMKKILGWICWVDEKYKITFFLDFQVYLGFQGFSSNTIFLYFLHKLKACKIDKERVEGQGIIFLSQTLGL